MFRGYEYRSHFIKNAWGESKYTQVRLLTKEEFDGLTKYQKRRVTKIQKVDIPVLEEIYNNEDYPKQKVS